MMLMGDAADEPIEQASLAARVAQGWRRNRRRVLVAAAATIVVAAILAVATWLPLVVPAERGALQLRNPIPLDKELGDLDRVSHWPSDWVAAVCDQPLLQLRNYERLPHATQIASCRSKVKPHGDADYIMVARFPTDFLMQVDLSNEGYDWYAFTYDRYSLLTFAIDGDDESVTNPTTGLARSPVLAPLEQFSFNIYSRPGPP